jgi:ABC-type Fe3+ transport system permease subunit
MSEYFHAKDLAGERVAVVLFGIVLILQSAMLLLLSRHAEHEGLFGESTEEERTEARSRYQLAPSLVLYAVAAVVGIILPYVGVSLYFLVAVYLALPMKTVARIVRRSG